MIKVMGQKIVSEIKQNNFKSQKLFLAVETPNLLPGLVVLESTVCEEEGHGFLLLCSLAGQTRQASVEAEPASLLVG